MRFLLNVAPVVLGYVPGGYDSAMETDFSMVALGPCKLIPIGSYSTVRNSYTVNLDVVHDSKMTLSSRHVSLPDGVEQANSLNFEYHLHTNCTITVSEPDLQGLQNSLRDITGENAISYHMEFFPTFPAIRLGPLYLDSVPSPQTFRPECEPMYVAHYLGHVSGITFFLRVLDGSRLVLGLVLPVAGCFGEECTTSVVIPYVLDDDCQLMMEDRTESGTGDRKFITQVLGKVAKVDSGTSLVGQYFPETMQIKIGALVLNIDSSFVRDFVQELDALLATSSISADAEV